MERRALSEFELAFEGWPISLEQPWATKGYSELSGVDTYAIVDRIIISDKYANQTNPRFRESYRSYLMQLIKECCYLLRERDNASDLLQRVSIAGLDSALLLATPWRFTYDGLHFIHVHRERFISCAQEQRFSALFHSIVTQGIDQGPVYSLAKYERVVHVILDLCFDIGWSTRCDNVSELKQIEGLNSNPERVATLRNLAITIARNLFSRGAHSAARQVLVFGFPDAPHVQTTLTKDRLYDLLVVKHPVAALKAILATSNELAVKTMQQRQIVEGVFHVLSGNM